MKRIRCKLHSRRGASILLALLLTLVATMICAVIVSAAVTSAYRVHDDRGEQQDSLAISSAARLVSDNFENAKYTYTMVTMTEDGVPIDPGVSPNPKKVTSDASPLSALLKEITTDDASAPIAAALNSAVGCSVDIRPDGQPDLRPVHFIFSLKEEDTKTVGDATSTTVTTTYEIKGTFSLVGTDAKPLQIGEQQKLFLRGRLTHETKTINTREPDGSRETGELSPDPPHNPITVPTEIWKTTVVQTWTLESDPLIKNEEKMLE